MLKLETRVYFLLVLCLMWIVEVKCVDRMRFRRQSRPRSRHHDSSVNTPGIMVEIDKRIHNGTIGAKTNINSDRNSDGPRVVMSMTCGGIYTQSQFIIESPQYPSNYPSNASCLYIFKGPYCQSNYTLQFLDFNVENSLGCINDRLEVKNRDALCGTQQGFRHYTTFTGTLELTFISNGDTTSRGFRILVSRSVCSTNVPRASESPGVFNPSQFPMFTSTISPPQGGYLPQSPTSPPMDFYPNYPSPKEPTCCATAYSDKRFFIANPGFPRSTSAAQCSFTILRANPKVCRLRIRMRYFWVGEQDASCSKGYLQVDGKLICGCHTGLKLVSPFDGQQGNAKVFRYVSVGANFDDRAYSGFALEVIQDECPKRYSPDTSDISDHQAGVAPRFSFYSDQFNRVSFPNLTHGAVLSSAALVAENTEVLEPIDSGFRPRVVKHVYYFESPDYTYDMGYSYTKPRDVEETNYLETVDLNALYPSGTDLTKCISWRSSEWNQLNNDVAWQRMPKCNDVSPNRYVPQSGQPGCKELTFSKGYFQSPGYPHYYPENLNLCYRFYKQRGYCQIRLRMLDFHVEDSFDCRKDYLLLSNNFRYCGRSLANTFILFDMGGVPYEQVRFVTNERLAGRGFRGIYEQLPCTEVPDPTMPPPPTPPPHTPTTPPSNAPCMHNIKNDYFTIDIYGHGKDMCNFDVYKANPDVCRLEITFATFDFICGWEYLQINGKQYCGKMSGETVYAHFEDRRAISIIYKRAPFTPGVGSGLKLHLLGRQTSTNCVEIPPLERIAGQAVPVQTNADNTGSTGNASGRTNATMSIQTHVLPKLDEVTVVLRKHYPEVCGVVMSVKEKKNESLCSIIRNIKNHLECDTLADGTIYVPYKDASDQLELKFKDVETVQEIEFKQISCDKKFIS